MTKIKEREREENESAATDAVSGRNLKGKECRLRGADICGNGANIFERKKTTLKWNAILIFLKSLTYPLLC